MAFVPALNTVMVEMRMGLDSQRVENTLYFQRGGGWELEEAMAMGADLCVWWDDFYAQRLSNALVLVEAYVTDLTDAESFAVSVPPTGTPTGGSSGEQAPNNVAPCISFRTAGRGRSNRGRNYICGVVNDDISSNILIGDFTSALTTAYNELFTVATGHDCTWSVVSRFSGVNPTTKKPIPRSSAVVTPITTAIFVDNVVDSQRRRLPKRGR